MLVKELIISALRSLRSHPKRSFLTMIGIIIGIASVITIMSLGNGVKQDTLKQFHATKTGKQTAIINYYSDGTSSANGFDQSDLSLLKSDNKLKIDSIKIMAKDNSFGMPSSVQAQLNDRNHLVELKPVKKTTKTMIAGQRITTNDNVMENNVANISRGLAKKIFHGSQNVLGRNIAINGQSYQIIGVYVDHSENPSNVLVPQRAYYRFQSTTSGNEIKLTFLSGAKVKHLGKHAQRLLNKNGSHAAYGSYEYEDSDALNEVGHMIDTLTYFVSAIAAISLFIAGIGVMNMMYISVSERTQEIGIRLAVGATQRAIMAQFLIEAIILTVIGGVIGFGLGVGIAAIISAFIPYKAVVSLSSVILALGVSTTVGLVFGILPAKQAANKNLIDILR